MSTNNSVVLQVKEKVERLVEFCDNLKSQLDQVSSEYEELKQTYNVKVLEIEKLEKQNEREEFARSLVSSGGDSTEAKKKINELVSEIDRCIALLNR